MYSEKEDSRHRVWWERGVRDMLAHVVGLEAGPGASHGTLVSTLSSERITGFLIDITSPRGKPVWHFFPKVGFIYILFQNIWAWDHIWFKHSSFVMFGERRPSRVGGKGPGMGNRDFYCVPSSGSSLLMEWVLPDICPLWALQSSPFIW